MYTSLANDGVRLVKLMWHLQRTSCTTIHLNRSLISIKLDTWRKEPHSYPSYRKAGARESSIQMPPSFIQPCERLKGRHHCGFNRPFQLIFRSPSRLVVPTNRSLYQQYICSSIDYNNDNMLKTIKSNSRDMLPPATISLNKLDEGL